MVDSRARPTPQHESQDTETVLRAEIQQLKGTLAVTRAEMQTLRTRASEVRAASVAKMKRLQRMESESANKREAALSERLEGELAAARKETEDLKREAGDARADADEANARRREESEKAQAREAVLSERLNEARKRDAEAAVEIARLNVEKAVLKRELYLQGLAGDGSGAPGDASKQVKRELQEGLGWAFERN